ncbi:protein kinase, partial [Streptomyces sp. NPDC058394]|uniref:AbiJ-related protein n=1 Tax=Streptomyces sp. NPDC058394 TaxID=3346477 RepID=UPI00365C976D
IQHRYNNPEDWDDDWIFTDSRFGLAGGTDEELLRFLAEMIHPEVRTDADEVERLLALFNDALTRDGYKLVPATAISGYPVYEARRTALPVAAGLPVRVHRPESLPVNTFPSAPGSPTVRPYFARAVEDGYQEVRRAARGERRDYACDRLPFATGGQAEVFQARHKPSGIVVVLKKLHQQHPAEHPIARMRREIYIGRQLDGHPHVMPVLDASADGTWFVMPLAEATAEERREELQAPGALRALVEALASVLSAMPEEGWIHRDIKPSNILLLDGRWTLADWGIVRRPPGQTTKVGRTGLFIGTEGFAAPELSENAHTATPAADVYSIGRVVAWALTGELPRTNLPLFPPPGPWRTIVKATTHNDPELRPQTAADVLQLIEREHTQLPEDPLVRAQALLESANTGDAIAAEALLGLIDDYNLDYELHVDVLTGLAAPNAAPALARGPHVAQRVLNALAAHVHGDDTHMVQFGEADTVVTWLQGIAAWAADYQQWELLEEATAVMCEWDGVWDQWRARDKVTLWLKSLNSDAAAIVAAVLKDHPDSAQHFSGLARIRTVDQRLRQAVAGGASATENEGRA